MTTVPGAAIYYTSSQKRWFRSVVDGTGIANPQAYKTNAVLPLTVVGAGKKLVDFDPREFDRPIAVNAVNGQRLMFGTNFLYESADSGQTLTSLGGLTADLSAPLGDVGQVSVIVAGGYAAVNGTRTAFPDVALVGTNGRTKAGGTVPTLILRTQANGTFAPVPNYPGAAPVSIALDPDNWTTGYIVDANGRLWRMTNLGTPTTTFVDITGNLTTAAGPNLSQLKSVAIYPNTAAPNDEVVFVGG